MDNKERTKLFKKLSNLDEEWNFKNFDDVTKQFSTIETFEEVVKVLREIPYDDEYDLFFIRLITSNETALKYSDNFFEYREKEILHKIDPSILKQVFKQNTPPDTNVKILKKKNS